MTETPQIIEIKSNIKELVSKINDQSEIGAWLQVMIIANDGEKSIDDRVDSLRKSFKIERL